MNSSKARWSAGLDHHHIAKDFRAWCAANDELSEVSFGGDGDDGEAFLYALSAFLETYEPIARDKERARNLALLIDFRDSMKALGDALEEFDHASAGPDCAARVLEDLRLAILKEAK